MERTTVRLPTKLLDQARKKASAERRTLTSLIEEGLRTVIAAPKNSDKHPVILPVSSARGGLQPGFAMESLARQVQEAEDQAYVARLRSGFE